MFSSRLIRTAIREDDDTHGSRNMATALHGARCNLTVRRGVVKPVKYARTSAIQRLVCLCLAALICLRLKLLLSWPQQQAVSETYRTRICRCALTGFNGLCWNIGD